MLLWLLLACTAVDTHASITVTKSNTTGAVVDNSSVNQAVSFSAADFPGVSTIAKVTVAVTFSKLGAFGILPPGFNEVGFSLASPGGGSQALIQNAGGAGSSFQNGAWFSTFTDTVNFDQDAAQAVNVDPNQIQAGTFQPDGGNLDSFVGADAVGNWTLNISDSAAGGFFNTPLTVTSWSVSITSVPEPDSIGLWAMAGLLAALLVFHRPRRCKGLPPLI